MTSSKKDIHVFVVSDATGITAERVMNAVLLQFDNINPIYKKFPYIKTKEQVLSILQQVKAVDGIIAYSLVSPELRALIKKQKRQLNIFAIDLLGPLMDKISKLWNLIPVLSPGLLKGISDESIRLAEAIDFTLKHDDGQNLETMVDADIIIFGVSRTSKTPTSLYISCNHSLKVANIPLYEGVEIPKYIHKSKAYKVGFKISPDKLVFIRTQRLRYAGEIDYTDIDSIRKELSHSLRIFSTIKGIEVIDVTNLSIEEVAEKIIEGRQEHLKQGKPKKS
ncbi:MAG: kinase/pyrophosphorylase [Thermodesulfovibrionales bacterium]|nr:kinase/pyrophosphorylase [Thermodesulfovibrionales bacterium]